MFLSRISKIFYLEYISLALLSKAAIGTSLSITFLFPVTCMLQSVAVFWGFFFFFLVRKIGPELTSVANLPLLD